MKMNLQYFAEESETEEVTAEPEQVEEESAEEKQEPEKKYTDEDVNKLINKKFAELEEKKQREIDEAKKLAKMNQSEKERYEIEKIKKENEEYKKKEQFYSLSKEASKMLAEHDIPTDDEVFDVVVKENAEDTKEKVEWFAGLVNKLVEKGVKQALSGKSPKINNTTSQVVNPFAKETFNLTEQGKLLKENPDLYNTLKAQANK